MKAALALLLAAASAVAAESPGLFVAPAGAARIRAAIASREPWTAEPARRLRAAADAALAEGPWTVTAVRPKDVAADIHEYYSEGPYWWPDPKHPGGPYIRQDGRTNPDRFMGNKTALNSMCDAVFALGAAAYLFDDARYAARANRVLAVWFQDARTRMSPDLEFGQAVRGHNTGRGSGIIDTRPLIRAAQGILLLERTSGYDPAVRDAVRQWFAAYVKWLTTSKKGLDEKKSGNNHASWWTTQVAAFALLAGDRAAVDAAFAWYRESIFPKQVEPSGAVPREEARTKSLGYSSMNLEAYVNLCRIAQVQGVDLWRVRTAQGATLDTVVRYLLPSLEDPKRWKKEQIIDFDNTAMYHLAFAGLGLDQPGYVEVYRRYEKPEGPWLAWVDLINHVTEPRP